MSTEISWTDETWNPTTGCDRVSAGCDNCYALTMAARLKAMGQPKYQHDGDPRTSGPGFGLTMHPDALEVPEHWRKPRRVFVNSMSDLFHDDVAERFVYSVFLEMAITRRHTYQVLTKRPQRMARLVPRIGAYDPFTGFTENTEPNLRTMWQDWPIPNVWLGTSVEDQRYANIRVPHLLKTPAAVRFLSMEPLLGPVTFRWAQWEGVRGHNHLDGLRQLDWVIIGGESGHGARPMELEWAERIVTECREADVPVFVKQLGTVRGGKQHHDIDTFPESLRVREFPA